MASTHKFVAMMLVVLCCPVVAQSTFNAAQVYEESPAGLQSQILDTVHALATSDSALTRVALDSLSIPDADKWFTAHFDSRFQTQLHADYAILLQKFQSHVSWVTANFSKFDDFGLEVGPFGSPVALQDSGFELLLPRPLDTLKVINCRVTSTASDPKHGPPSWVSSFVFLDGRFRFIGGTYPFWAESLNSLRGPMSMAPAVIHGRTVQGIAFRKDQKVPGVDAIVQLKIDIGHSGHVDHIKVLSGDEPFVKDAKDYVKAADFGSLPNIPQLANAKREWEMEVAFFTAKQ